MNEGAQLRIHLLEQVSETHRRFAESMEHRLASVETGDVERYFGFVSGLVAKLEDDKKTLRDVAREMVAEYAGLVMSELAK